MAQPFFDRLKAYYEAVAAVLRGEADAAAIFPNPTDRGASRERIYSTFLEQHAPSKCNVFIGGFLFDEDGQESKQLDVLVTTDTAPRFNLQNKDGEGRAFSPVEGTIAAISVKSTLDKAELYDAISGLASIPPTRPLEGRLSPVVNIPDYDQWPLKVLYATKGINPETLLNHLNAFYEAHPEIPQGRRVDIVHVAGSCVIVRMERGMEVVYENTGKVGRPEPGTYHLFTKHPDTTAITLVLGTIQSRATGTTHILFNYGFIGSRVLGL